MFKIKITNIFIILISIKIFISSTTYSAVDIAGYMKENLKEQSLTSYYMLVDPDKIIEYIRNKMINKYNEILKKKYDLNTLVILAKKLQDYTNSNFADELYKEIEDAKLKNLKSLIILVTTDDRKINIFATETIKNIFSERVINRLIEKMQPDIKPDDWFSNVFELLKRIDILHQQYNFKVNIEDL